MIEHMEERALATQEQQSVALKKVKKEKQNIFKLVERDEHGEMEIVPNINEDTFQDLRDATGCDDPELGIRSIWKASVALTESANDTNELMRNLKYISNSMAALEPKDAIEGQLIAQLTVLHEQSMHWLGKSLRAGDVNFMNACVNASTKLVNRYQETLRTLMRYRQGGDQKIIVENVNVSHGGQAVVGHVVGGGSK